MVEPEESQLTSQHLLPHSAAGYHQTPSNILCAKWKAIRRRRKISGIRRRREKKND
jgi:hypothetical protein